MQRAVTRGTPWTVHQGHVLSSTHFLEPLLIAVVACVGCHRHLGPDVRHADNLAHSTQHTGSNISTLEIHTHIHDNMNISTQKGRMKKQTRVAMEVQIGEKASHERTQMGERDS